MNTLICKENMFSIAEKNILITKAFIIGHKKTLLIAKTCIFAIINCV